MGKGTGIFGLKELKELYSTFSEKDLFNSGNFDPWLRNLRTGATLSRTHHCERCTTGMSKKCYENFHYAFCPEWTYCNGKRVRCGERFALRSDGCAKHPRIGGFNKKLYAAVDGLSVSISDFDDLDPSNENEAPGDVREQEILDEWIDKMGELHGYIPQDFYTKYCAEKKKVQNRTHRDQKKANADLLSEGRNKPGNGNTRKPLETSQNWNIINGKTNQKTANDTAISRGMKFEQKTQNRREKPSYAPKRTNAKLRIDGPAKPEVFEPAADSEEAIKKRIHEMAQRVWDQCVG